MATSTISNTIEDPSGTPIEGVRVVAKLMPSGGFRTADAVEVARYVETTTDASGDWSLSLERNAGITPSNSYYQITEYVPGDPATWLVSVGSSNQTVLAAQTRPLGSAAAQYLTQASADSRYQALGSLGSGTPGTETPDHAGTAGVSTSASRDDHIHPIVAAAAGASAVGDSAAEGVATSFARSDHKHSREAFATPAATGDANAAGSATTVAHSDHVHKGVVTNDAWTSYTPTLTQSGAVTKTVTYAKYQRTGRMISVNVMLAVTGTGSAGDQVIVGLPVTAALSSSLAPIGTFIVADSSAVLNYVAGCSQASTTTVYGLVNAAANTLGVSGFTAALASGDTVGFCATYEASA